MQKKQEEKERVMQKKAGREGKGYAEKRQEEQRRVMQKKQEEKERVMQKKAGREGKGCAEKR